MCYLFLKFYFRLNQNTFFNSTFKRAINYLSNNPQFLRKTDSTMTNINEANYRLNENMEALKHNFLFRGYFKKQEKARSKVPKKEIEDKKY